jgi:hypothetical protein
MEQIVLLQWERRGKTKLPASSISESAFKAQEATVVEASKLWACYNNQTCHCVKNISSIYEINEERRTLKIEYHKKSNLVLQKITNKSPPEDDQMELFIARKQN